MTRAARPEFSRPVAVASLDQGGIALTIEADADERTRLAKRFGLVAIDNLTGQARLTPEEGGTVFRLDVSFAADVRQTCVVTLEELPAHVAESFTRQYSTSVEPMSEFAEHLDLDAEEPPDPIVDGHIDVGEAVAEELALALDPFPRKPGISFTDYSSGPDGGTTGSGGGAEAQWSPEGPFAALQRLKDRLK
jgi:uncharacterized metal-binding protein YceD (DUF177 family)